MGGKGRKQPGVLRRLLPKIHGCLRLLRFLVHSVLSSPSDPNRKVRRETRKEPKEPPVTTVIRLVSYGFLLTSSVVNLSPLSSHSIPPASRPPLGSVPLSLRAAGGRYAVEGRVERA